MELVLIAFELFEIADWSEVKPVKLEEDWDTRDVMLMLTEFVRVEVAAMLLEMVAWFDVMLVMLLLIVRIEDDKLVFVVEMP